MTERSYKTPGVYVDEIPSPVPEVQGVITAMPVFIGFTEFAAFGAYGEPVRISSAREFAFRFGGMPPAGAAFQLAVQIGLFFANGGASCLVISAGSYWEGRAPEAAPEATGDWRLAAPAADALLAALAVAGEVVEITMLVVPEACLLSMPDHARLIQAMLRQAGTLRNRMAILDLPGCIQATDLPALRQGRADLAAALAAVAEFASYGAAYAPALKLQYPGGPGADLVTPPSGAVAGVWARSDLAKGVWVPPAGVQFEVVADPQSGGVADLAFRMGGDEQGDFNAPLDGVAVDILRFIPGYNLVVWGARTLDGNSDDWRYLAVRRACIYVEQSIGRAMQAFAFEPNNSSTWGRVKAMVENFLATLWQAGALQGAKPSDAFFVSVGLGTTMTAQDVVAGRLRLEIGVAIAHPAEFILLAIEQEMQPA
ncbi:phage tail sheath family protein [Sphingomonas sp. OTU376]|uniref:phage tail sheath family protein n=1 Tax=Sphingomonas sp. OTU376 TaxID=3043863 RepID=UPI00313A8E4E